MFKLPGSPHDGYHRVGRGAIWTGATSSTPRPSPLPPETGGLAHHRNDGASTAHTAAPEKDATGWKRPRQAAGRRLHQRARRRARSPSRTRRPEGAAIRSEHGWHHESRRFRPVTWGESAFLRVSAPANPKNTKCYDTKEHHYGPDQTQNIVRLYGAAA